LKAVGSDLSKFGFEVLVTNERGLSAIDSVRVDVSGPMSPATLVVSSAFGILSGAAVPGSTVTLEARGLEDTPRDAWRPMVGQLEWVQVSGPPVALNNPLRNIHSSGFNDPTEIAQQLTVDVPPGIDPSIFEFEAIYTSYFGPVTRSSYRFRVGGENIAPNAVTAGTLDAEAEAQVRLDGAGSDDPDGVIASYLWTQTGGPAVALSGADTAVASFAAPAVTGPTTLTFSLTVTDEAGASASAPLVVNVADASSPPVADDVAPVVTAPVDIIVEATAVQTVVDLGLASANDAVDGPLTPTADQSGPFAVGTHVVTSSAVDAAGNIGTAVQSVTVQDTTPPVLTVPADVSVTETVPAVVTLGVATASDIFDVAVANDAPASFGAGVTAVTWTATDVHGNVSTGTQQITVTEPVAPPPGDGDAVGTLGDDFLAGGTGGDTLSGLDGDDYLDGGAGDDLLLGGEGNDRLVGGAGADRMEGGPGNDIYIVDDLGDAVIELPGAGEDEVRSEVSFVLGADLEHLSLQGSQPIDGTGNAQGNWLGGNSAANTLSGLGGDDYLDGGAGEDLLLGGEGNDRLVGGAGADRMEGGPGNDIYGVDDLGDVVVELPGAGEDEVRSEVTYVLGADVEHLTLQGTQSIDGTGNAQANWVGGNSAANTLSGLGGDDYLDGEAGDDLLLGGEGNDRLVGGPGADRLEGGPGNDIYGVDDLGDAVIELPGAGEDEVRSEVSYVLGADLEHLSLQGSQPIDGTGNAQGNWVGGNSAANTLSGLGGDDHLSGREGDDVLIGGPGDDWLEGGFGNDRYRIEEGDGYDVINEPVDAGADNAVVYLGALDRYSLWFHQDGDDLVITWLGSASQVAVHGWAGNPADVPLSVITPDGMLTGAQLINLMAEMAAYGPPAAGSITLTAAQQAAIDSARDLAWQ
jgi:Ca2+-binding RTX toxin-like protein